MNGNAALTANDASHIHTAIRLKIEEEIRTKTETRDRKLDELQNLERPKSDDRSQQLDAREALSREITRLNLKLLALRETVDRIKNGVYGICRHCEEPIPMGRLQAMPEAMACVNCVDEKEQPHLVHV